jgi:hypothetical protein
MAKNKHRHYNVIRDAENLAISIAECMNDHDGCYHYIDSDLDQPVCRLFLGTIFSIDPCGRYHHVLVDDTDDPDVKECYLFWEVLENTLSDYGLSLESGDDPCDVFVARIMSE